MSESILTLSNVTAGYVKNLPVVRDVTCALSRGKITTMIGPNGAGKSTLLRTIAGMTMLFKGEIFFKAQPIHKLQPWEVLERGIGFVPQGRCNFPFMSVKENLELGLHRVPNNEKEARYEEALTLFPILKERLRQLAGNMSGGEQQLLETAMVLVQSPELLLLDEPSLGLSPAAQSQVFDFLQAIRQEGITILMVEQNAAAALEISDEAIVLDQGRIFTHSSADEIKHDPRVRELYLGGSVAALDTE